MRIGKKFARNKSAPAEMSPAEARKARGGIQSIQRAIAILEDVARHRDGINLADLSKSVGLHNSTTFHLIKTMAQLGYVIQQKDSKRYRLGSRLFTLAAGALDENALLAAAAPIVEKLTADTGEAAHFAIRSGKDAVLIASTKASGMVQLADRAGATRPAYATAIGKVLMAAIPPGQLEQVIGDMELRRLTPKTIVEPEALRREIEEVRRKGIAFDDGEFDAELRCVAVAVHDFSGRVAGAIGISGPIWRLSLQSLQEKARPVRESAAALSAELGSRKSL
jgi:IclR family KDG regulon transcriptional repressor